MTKEQAIKILKSKMDGHTDTSYEWAETVRMAIKALEQESTFQKKAEIVISQLRADRDRLQDAFDRVRAEIEKERSFQRAIDEYDIATGLRKALEILDKYKAESEPQETEDT